MPRTREKVNWGRNPHFMFGCWSHFPWNVIDTSFALTPFSHDSMHSAIDVESLNGIGKGHFVAFGGAPRIAPHSVCRFRFHIAHSFMFHAVVCATRSGTRKGPDATGKCRNCLVKAAARVPEKTYGDRGRDRAKGAGPMRLPGVRAPCRSRRRVRRAHSPA
jgi:hypothetical protein